MCPSYTVTKVLAFTQRYQQYSKNFNHNSHEFPHIYFSHMHFYQSLALC